MKPWRQPTRLGVCWHHNGSAYFHSHRRRKLISIGSAGVLPLNCDYACNGHHRAELLCARGVRGMEILTFHVQQYAM